MGSSGAGLLGAMIGAAIIGLVGGGLKWILMKMGEDPRNDANKKKDSESKQS